jgi:hypothetical protein
MANAYQVGNAPAGASYAGNPNFGMQLGQIISQYPKDFMQGRQNRRTIQAEDAFKDPKDWQNEDGSPNVNKVFAKGMELGGLPYATQLLGFMQKQPIYNKILRENDEGGYDDQGGQQSPAIQPPARPNNGTAGPGNLAPPPPRLIPVQPRLSSAGTDNQGPQTINSLASEVFGERDVTDLLPRYAAAVRNKLGEPLTPEQEQTARALMTRTAGSQGWSQAPRQSSADIMPPSGPDSAVERGMNGPGGTGGIAQNGPGGLNAAPSPSGGVSGGPAPNAGFARPPAMPGRAPPAANAPASQGTEPLADRNTLKALGVPESLLDRPEVYIQGPAQACRRAASAGRSPRRCRYPQQGQRGSGRVHRQEHGCAGKFHRESQRADGG